MLREILDSLPPDQKIQLMAAFNGGFSYQVEHSGYCIGVYQPPSKQVLEELGAWSLWQKT